jgi:plastocyanin
MLLTRVALAAALLAALGGGASARQTGVIHGRVSVSPTASLGERPSVTDPSARRHEPIDRRRAVVYLEGGMVQAFGELRTSHARMDQKGEQFVPHLLAITVGSSVDFPNSDTTFHSVFSLSRTKPFDLGRYKPGRTGTVVFDRPGPVSVFCDIHSHMSAYIFVFSHPFFAVTDDEGRYSIPGVPAGTYSVAVWNEMGQAQPRRVTVVQGEAVEADFKIGREGS